MLSTVSRRQGETSRHPEYDRDLKRGNSFSHDEANARAHENLAGDLLCVGNYEKGSGGRSHRPDDQGSIRKRWNTAGLGKIGAQRRRK